MDDNKRGTFGKENAMEVAATSLIMFVASIAWFFGTHTGTDLDQMLDDYMPVILPVLGSAMAFGRELWTKKRGK